MTTKTGLDLDRLYAIYAEHQRLAPWRRMPSLACGETTRAKTMYFDAAILAQACAEATDHRQDVDEWATFHNHWDRFTDTYDVNVNLECPIGSLLYDTFQSLNPAIKQLGAAFFVRRSEQDKALLSEMMQAFAEVDCSLD